ncbi:prolyl oligopeptidase family serine peptidase [Sphingomicrobium marinum]|uniref:prolyl oligopeptidase family serine peptidase n=1 Tax=Sphingomicrobium marinum TaxID=1227950 RepID=UPI00223E9876|nr:prolyl oligopeptidase family serine peptidase [Sphingomicrobium marinum]
MKKPLLGGTAAALALATPAAAQDGVPGPDDDPFIWLEDARSDEALAWVSAENEKTEAALFTDPRFEELRKDAYDILTADDRVPGVSIWPQGLMNFWQDDENPKGLVRFTTMESYRTDDPDWDVVLDIDALAKAEGREWVYRGLNCLPPERKYCLLALSDGGKDASELREFDLEKREFVEGGFFFPEGLGSVQWIDKDTVIVTRDWGDGTLTESEYPYVSKILKRGQSLDQATEIFRGEPTDVSAGASIVRDGDYVIQGRMASRGLNFHEREYYWEVDGNWVKLDIPTKANPAGIVDGQMLLSLDVPWESGGVTYPADALLSTDLEAFKANPNGVTWEPVWLPADRQTRRGANSTAGSMYVGVLDNVRGRVYKYNYVDGAWVKKQLPLPDNATLSIGSASDVTDEVLLYSTDFLNPTTTWFYNGETDQLEQLKQQPERFDADGYVIEQMEATSADGSKIPYFVVRAEDTVMDGSTPTLLTGYGGFQVSRVPAYLGSTGKLWLERGGAYVLGNMRGGGEFGPEWHQTAIRENKQRTWDDFIAIAQEVVDRGLTSPDHLGISGGSQGGLLVGTAFTQRPDLFDAAIVAIPLFDMLRYHEIGRGASWIGEYGDPRIPEQREWIEPYSPYQKLVPGAQFPKVLYVTSTADDRTHPSHGRKAAAKMDANGQPYLYYEDMVGGHSGGNDPEQQAKLLALRYTYLMQQLMD